LEDFVAAPNLENLEPKIRDQVEYIRKEFKNSEIAKGEYGADGIGIGIATSAAGVAFMYAEGQILVRENYLVRVQEILDMLPTPVSKIGEPPPASPPVEPVIDGVTVLSLKRQDDQPTPTVIDALEAVDRVLGPGYATPNHVLTVTGDGGPCPATEPAEVYDGIEPYPSVCPANVGAGISIYVADTGLIRYKDDTVVPKPGPAGPGEIVTNVGTPNAWLKGVRGDIDPRLPEPPGTIGPYVGHGTFVAGVTRCMAPGADIYVANAFKVAGSVLETHLVRHLEAALAHGYDLFHLSITAPTRKDLPLISFEGWLRRLHQYKGVACVVAAGNSGSRLPTWPAAFPEVVSVGALAGDWCSRARFSNYGPWVDVYAPGRDLINAFGIGTYKCYTHPYKPEERKFYGMAKWSGTSFSTPIVTGLIAARMSRTGENGLEAAAALLAEARSQAIPGVGPVLLPCCHEHHACGKATECCCRAHRHHHHDC
jgi:subtilisin family serine protease